jgi:heme-degrading monooxygenase HmoA
MEENLMTIKTYRLIVVSAICLVLLFLGLAVKTESQVTANSIARVWEGRTAHAKADAFEKYLNGQGIAQMTSAAGNLGVQIFRRPTTDAVEFQVITYWQSRDAIKKVVGEDIERAVSLPREREFLLEPVTTVRHYQVVYSKYQ